MAIAATFGTPLWTRHQEPKAPWARYRESKTPGLCQILEGGSDYCDGPVHECGKANAGLFQIRARDSEAGSTIQYLCSEHAAHMRKSWTLTPVSPAIGVTPESGENTLSQAA